MEQQTRRRKCLFPNGKRMRTMTFKVTMTTSAMVFIFAVVFSILSFIPTSDAHVGLTFPPARKYDLDFLDSVRTKPPCGMPKGSIKTSLVSGSTINVTWHLSYPHQGGYRLEMMDSQERQVLDLTPKKGKEEFIHGDPTAQWYTVKLPPDFLCEDCTVRLLRQASEWSGEYRFWSCADVDIIDRTKYKEVCSSHGKPVAGRCLCHKGFWGNRCQYEDECDTESECSGGNGKCIDLGGTALPKKQCFCNPGFHGEKCAKRNTVKLPGPKKPLDVSQHTKRILSNRMTLYYKTIPNAKEENKEIEFILEIEGTSYGAIGWRPASFTKKCQRWPFIANSTIERQGKNSKLQISPSDPKAESEPEPEVEPKKEPKADSEPEAVPEGEAKAGAEPEPSGKHRKSHKHSYDHAHAEPESEAKPKSDSEPEPKAEGESEPKAEGEPEPKAEGEPEPKSKGEPEPKAEGKPEPKAEGEPEPKSEGEPKSGDSVVAESEPKSEKTDHTHHDGKGHSQAESEPEGEPKPEGTSEPKSEPAAEPKLTSSSEKPKTNAGKLRFNLRPKNSISGEVSVETPELLVTRSSRRQRSPIPDNAGKAEPEPEGKPEGSSEPEPEGKPEGSSEPEPEGKPEGKPEGEPTSESEPQPESSGTSEPHPSESSLEPHQWVPRADFHAMDCIDLIMGGARGPLSRIRDYYTRDRSTPRLDSFWGGKDDITSSTGWEEGNKTVLIFRRKIRSTDGPDHSLDGGPMHVIWARGQEPGDYVHKPRSGLEVANKTMSNFYARDEIKYHGHGAQRGITSIDFFEKPVQDQKTQTKNAENCEDSWRQPSSCSNDDPALPCTYLAKWQYIPQSDSVKFTIQTRKPERWTGIGFGDSPQMRNSDAILGWVSSAGQFFVMDVFMNSYQPPVLDTQQDIKNETGTFVDGLVTLSFIRPILSSDTKDVSLDTCKFFLFPIEGGIYKSVSKRITQHERTPIISAEKICISRKCRPKIVKKPSEISYAFDIKLTGGFAEGWEAPKIGTNEFADWGKRISGGLETELKKVDGFASLSLKDIKRVGNEALAKMELMVKPNTELAVKNRVQRALKDSIASGKAGSLQVDPNYLELSEPQARTVNESEVDLIDDETSSSVIGPRLWIVIGCVAALIVLALIQAALTIYKTSGKASSHKGSPSSGSGMAWRDYSETNYGYDAYDEKSYAGGNAMPLTATPTHANHHYNGNHHQPSHSHGGGPSSQHIANMSLPRPQSQSQSKAQRHSNSSNGQHTYASNGAGNGPPAPSHNPDFYFMPSQRKYSGEVVRVYVDHNNKR